MSNITKKKTLSKRRTIIIAWSTCRRLALTVIDPDREGGVDEVVHHVAGVVRRGRDAKQLLTARHRRVVDGLHVDAVLLKQILRQRLHQRRVANLHSEYTRTSVTSADPARASSPAPGRQPAQQIHTER